jgi:drug/metabolite transporter (DMT)-like permease
MPVAAPRPGLLQSVPLGLRYMAGSALFFSLMTLFVKLAGERLPTMEIVFGRSLIMAAVTYGMLRRRGVPPLGNDRRLLLARGAIGVTALSLFYFAIPRIPLGDATALFYMAPIWTAFSAAIILRERTAGLVLVGMGVSFAGVLLIAKPSVLFGSGLNGLDPLAVGAVVSASLLSGLVYTIVRKLRATDAPNVIIFYLSWMGVAGALPFAGSWVLPVGAEWVWLLGAGLATQLGQICLTQGLHLERAGRAMSVGYLQVVFAFVWGALVFADVPDLLSLFGAALIVGSVLLIARKK